MIGTWIFTCVLAFVFGCIARGWFDKWIDEDLKEKEEKERMRRDVTSLMKSVSRLSDRLNKIDEEDEKE